MDDSRYIDFISAYCDRWCERCAFTEQCSAFAAQCALAMCEDPHEAIELALGRPHPEGDDPSQPDASSSFEDFDNTAPTADEMEQYRREDNARRQRTNGTGIMQAAHAYTMLAHRWLKADQEPLRAKAAAVATGSSSGAARVNDEALAMDAAQIVDALDVVSWDQYLIAAKLHRALRGRDRHQHGDADHHPTQNDWNGSAKVALISIERSEAAWRLIAHWTAGELPGLLADHLLQLRGEVEREFPNARSFVRPGFDERA